MSISKAIVILAFALFLGLFGWTLSEGPPIGELIAAILQHPWTIVLAADEILGFVLFSVVIAFSERSVLRAAFWIIPIFLIGHIVSAVYLLGNFDRIRARLSGPD